MSNRDTLIEEVMIHNLHDGDILIFKLIPQDDDPDFILEDFNNYADAIVDILDPMAKEMKTKYSVLVLDATAVSEIEVVRTVGKK